MKITKKQKLLNNDIKAGAIYKLSDAISFLKKYASKKFDESIDLSIILGIDAKNQINKLEEFLSLPKMPEKKLELLFLLKVMMQKGQKKMVQKL